jgi:glycosyltransferase involved in cell wall biosynthesis
MRVLWLTWKDIRHPLAGGAELMSSELARRLVQDGHEVTVVTAAYPGAPPEEVIDGYRVVRAGNRYTVYWRAYRRLRRGGGPPHDVVIEEINTVPFFSRLYLRRSRRVLMFYMLCREIWFFQLPRMLGWIGYLLEPLYLRLLARDRAIVLSESTRQDLLRHGFGGSSVSVISAAIALEPIADLSHAVKETRPTIVSLGSVRAMKQTLHQIHAFEIAKGKIPELRLQLAGETDSAYGRKVLRAIERSPFRDDIEYLGRISDERKPELLRRAHVITVTSVKEGWGLIVTEAASQGTPAVVYDIDGLRDAVQHGQTGLITAADPHALAGGIVELLRDPELYAAVRDAGWRWSRELTFANVYARFVTALERAASGGG